MMEKSFKDDLKEQTKIIFDYQSLVNTVYGFVKVEITKETLTGYGDIDGHIYFVYVRNNKTDLKANYVSFPQDFESVVGFLLGLLYGVHKDD